MSTTSSQRPAQQGRRPPGPTRYPRIVRGSARPSRGCACRALTLSDCERTWVWSGSSVVVLVPVGVRRPLLTAQAHRVAPRIATGRAYAVGVERVPHVLATAHPSVAPPRLPPAQRAPDPTPAITVVEPRRRAVLFAFPESQWNHPPRHGTQRSAGRRRWVGRRDWRRRCPTDACIDSTQGHISAPRVL